MVAALFFPMSKFGESKRVTLNTITPSVSTSVCWVDMGEGNTLLDELLEAASGFLLLLN